MINSYQKFFSAIKPISLSLDDDAKKLSADLLANNKEAEADLNYITKKMAEIANARVDLVSYITDAGDTVKAISTEYGKLNALLTRMENMAADLGVKPEDVGEYSAYKAVLVKSKIIVTDYPSYLKDFRSAVEL